jgi:acyl-coenzyme A thioesterase PaaI-like protein
MAGALGAVHAARHGALATVDLTLHSVRPIGPGGVTVHVRPVRVGRRLVTTRAELRATTDAPGAPPALVATTTCSRFFGPGDEERREAGAMERHLVGRAQATLPAPFREAVSLSVVDAGAAVADVTRTAYTRNSFGTVQGGVIAALAELSAELAGGPGHAVRSLHVRYVDRLDDDPLRATPTVVRHDDHGSAAEIELRGRAGAGALVALALAHTVRRAG